MTVALLAVGLLLLFGCGVIAYAIMALARSVAVMTEQLRLGVRLGETIAPSALETEPPPEGVVSWPSANGWQSMPPTVPDDILEPLDEEPELRGRRGAVHAEGAYVPPTPRVEWEGR